MNKTYAYFWIAKHQGGYRMSGIVCTETILKAWNLIEAKLNDPLFIITTLEQREECY